MLMARLLLVFCFSIFSFSLPAQNFDIRLLRDFNGGPDPKPDAIMRDISKSVTPISVTIPIVGVGYGIVKRDVPVFRRYVGYCGGLALANGVSLGLKYAIGRERPYMTYPDIYKKDHVGTKSFPSGHTTMAFATATMLTLTTKNWYVVVPAYAWACSVGWSRLYLGVHYPSDVLAGALIGTGFSWLGYRLTLFLQDRYLIPKMFGVFHPDETAAAPY